MSFGRSLKRGIFALFGASTLVECPNYRFFKFGNSEFKAHYTHFKFANAGFYPSDVLRNRSDGGFDSGDVGFKAIYRILKFVNSECKGADG